MQKKREIDHQTDRVKYADKELTKEAKRIEKIGGNRDHKMEWLSFKYGYELGILEYMKDHQKGEKNAD